MLLHHVDMGDVANISNIHAAYIFRTKVRRLIHFCVHCILKRKDGQIDPTGPTLSSIPSPCPFQNIMLYVH
jgi:hypothetical protein